jgi:hypothetical protein
MSPRNTILGDRSSTSPLRKGHPVAFRVAGALAVSLVWVGPSRAHPASYVLVNAGMRWGTNGLERDCKLMIQLTGSYVAGIDPQRVIVDIMNRNGVPTTAGNDLMVLNFVANTSGAIDQTVYYDPSGSYVSDPNGANTVRVQVWEAGTTGEPTRSLTLRIPEYCPDIQTESQLDTLYTCGNCPLTKDIPADSVKVFKTLRAGAAQPTLYALRRDDESAATWGEIITGRFKAPKCGVLQVSVSGVSGPTDTATVFLDGWNGQGTIAGSGVTYNK